MNRQRQGAEPWQVADYRSLEIKELFRLLASLHITLTEESFLLYAQENETPEELLECLWVHEEDLVSQEKAYLLLFELWRRLCPYQKSLSIFCDALDHQISLFEQHQEGIEELLLDSLDELEDLLDQGVDEGMTAQEVFQEVTSYLAHDLEGFLYDYIYDLLEGGNEEVALSLVDGFASYVSDKKWFDLLKGRLLSLSYQEEAERLIFDLLEQQEESPDVPFLLEFSAFLIHQKDPLSARAIQLLSSQVCTEQQRQEMLTLQASFHESIGKEQVQQQILSLFAKQ